MSRPASFESASVTEAKGPRVGQFLLAELGRMVAVTLGACVLLAVLVQLFFGNFDARQGFIGGVGELVMTAHLDKNGMPLWGRVEVACRHTLPMVGLAVLLLSLGSVLLGVLLETYPRLQAAKTVVLAVSAVPSFMFPFLPYLIFPLEFRGFLPETPPYWPALFLAVGDLNLISVTSLFGDSLRHELGRPHTRISRALRGSVGLDVWPYAAVAIFGAVAGRIPHLLGGTIVLEMLYNSPGLGNLVWEAIVAVPADYKALLWVCLVSLISVRAFHAVYRATRLLLVVDDLPSLEGPSGESESYREAAAAAPSSGHAVDAPQDAPEIRIPTFRTRAIRRVYWLPWPLWAARVRYYLALNPANKWKMAIAISFWTFFAAGIVLCLAYGDANLAPGRAAEPYLPPSSEYWLGTNSTGDDVLAIVCRGLKQQWAPLLVAMLVGLSGVVPGLLGVIGSFIHGWLWSQVVAAIVFLFDELAELIDAMPKLVILLACWTFFAPLAFIFKMYLVIGLLFAPQVYRAVRDDLLVLRRAFFLEAAWLTGTPWYRILLRNVLRNHSLNIVIVQAALVFGSIIQVDAMLGFAGLRNRSEVFLWGSILGMGTEEFLQDAPFMQINDWVVWAPFLGVWLAIVAAFTTADALKVPLTGYAYRIR